MIYNRGINDMPRGWSSDNEYNRRVYTVWYDMFRRCYNSKALMKRPSYRGCEVSRRWWRLSQFVKDVKKIPNYEYWKSNPNTKITLDKDSIVKGNRVYGIGLVKFMSIQDSIREMDARIKSYRVGVYIDNELIGEYNSIQEIEEELGVPHQSIGHCLRGRQKTCYGYTFKALD